MPMDPDEEEEMMNIEDSATSHDKQVEFVKLLKSYSCILDKSQIPSAKVAKNAAMDQFISQWAGLYGETLTRLTLMKKVNNMKTRVKTKADANQTGNKRILLQKWEKEFLDFFKSGDNPTFVKIPGAVSSIVPLRDNGRNEPTTSLVSTISGGQRAASAVRTIPPPPMENKRKRSAEDYVKAQETDETRDLSNQQLQRLVLLEQLKTMRLKRAKLEASAYNTSQVYQIVHESSILRVSSQEIRDQDTTSREELD